MTSVQIPDSTSIVEVSIIDTTAQLRDIPAQGFFGPTLEGFERFHGVAYAFLITHTDTSTGSQRRIIFDLGPAKDWQNDLPKPIVENIKTWGADIEISKYVSEILEETGFSLDSLEAVVWSHAHWDHIGRVSLFPKNVTLITGPGLKSAFSPGWPTNPTAVFLERDYADRKVTELDFGDSSLTLGDFKAIDYFGDGSFYFLSAPGHAVGHVNALARTTAASSQNPGSTFILMGADSFHHGSQMRPNSHIPLPDNIPGPLPNFPQYTSMCPGHIFDVVHPSHPHRQSKIPAHYGSDFAANHRDPKKSPFFTVSSTPEGKSLAVDLPAAKDTIKGLQMFDVDEDVLLVAAHDTSLYEVLEYFPRAANEWKAKGWKGKGRWRFLGDLEKAVEIANKEAK